MSMRWRVVLAAVLLSVPADGGAQDIENTSHVAPDGSRVLQQSVVVPATLADVWNAMTTAEGVRSWAAPVAFVDFRLGGIWESSYRPGATRGDPANIKNLFISYIPMRMVAMQVIQAPPDFEHHELVKQVFSVYEMAEAGPGAVRVTVSMVGYQSDPAYDAMYRFFEAGNAWSLQSLARALAARQPADR